MAQQGSVHVRVSTWLELCTSALATSVMDPNVVLHT